jgi:hypothetical protein
MYGAISPFSTSLHCVNGHCRLYFSLRAALLYVGFHCLLLHVSAYIAIFRCVGFFIYLFSYNLRILLRCFFGSIPFFFTWSHSACFPFVFCSCVVFLRAFFGVFYLLFIVVICLFCATLCCTQKSQWTVVRAISAESPTPLYVRYLSCHVCLPGVYSVRHLLDPVSCLSFISTAEPLLHLFDHIFRRNFRN